MSVGAENAEPPAGQVADGALRLWVPRDAPARFPAGTKVMAKFEEHYIRGVVVKARPTNPARDGVGKSVNAYAIRIEPWGAGERSKIVTAPVDLDLVVRKCSAEEAAKPTPPEPLGAPEWPSEQHASAAGGGALPPPPITETTPMRFGQNEMIMANMGERGWVRARVVGLRPLLTQEDGSSVRKAYQLQIEQVGAPRMRLLETANSTRHAAMLLRHCCCYAAAMLRQCCGNAAAMLRQCCCHAAVMLLPCCGNAAAMLLHCCCHAAAMLLPCCCYAAAMLLPCCGNAAALLLPCCRDLTRSHDGSCASANPVR